MNAGCSVTDDDLAAFFELLIACRGPADLQTGYLINISQIDAAAKSRVLPLLTAAVQGHLSMTSPLLLREMVLALVDELGKMLKTVTWRLTPYHSLSMAADDLDTYLLSRQFEFAASHRLSCPSLSESENRAIFGKCANENGHGHNYRIEPRVAVPLHPTSRERLTAHRLGEIVERHVLARFDHKHLNLDTPEFASLNPSVEHIAKVCHDLLREPILQAGGRLLQITVWETEKTSCTYPAEPHSAA